MRKRDFMFTSESVTPGHPDKLCDQISDAIVDHLLQQDPYTRVLAECAVSTSIVFLSTRFSPNANADYTAIARKVIDEVGYRQPSFNARDCSILTSLEELHDSKERNFDEQQLSDAEIDQVTARNQATVFGFACNQSEGLIPLPIWLAHQLARQLFQVQHSRMLPYLSPDGKTQVGVEYRDRRPHRIHSITVVASQIEDKSPDFHQLQDDIRETVIIPAFDGHAIRPDEQTRIYINPDGPVPIGGPAIHSGLTGRKNAIDTYGEYAKHSGAALSGKDPIRIDRVGAYAARHAAKNVVAAGLADECEVQLSYSIGSATPISVQVETFGTGKIPEEDITDLVEKNFDFRLAGIIKQFNLRFLPSQNQGKFFQKLAVYGHVGRTDLDLPWERTDQVDKLAR
ncbi:MAG: methionine adenosyltransferase [Elainellaceae cyanobacterium]